MVWQKGCKLKSPAPMSVSRRTPVTLKAISACLCAKSSDNSSGNSQYLSAMKTMPAFSKPSDSMSLKAAHSGDSKSVPPLKKVSAAFISLDDLRRRLDDLRRRLTCCKIVKTLFIIVEKARYCETSFWESLFIERRNKNAYLSSNDRER